MRNNDIVAGFDPGGSTGYCFARIDDSKELGFVILRCNVIQWEDRIPAIKALLSHFKPVMTIVEDFVLYKDKAKSMVGKRFLSSMVIGVIETCAYELHIPGPKYMMTSSISRTSIPTAHMALMPALDAEQKEHCMDAYKHVRYHIVCELAKRRQTEQTIAARSLRSKVFSKGGK